MTMGSRSGGGGGGPMGFGGGGPIGIGGSVQRRHPTVNVATPMAALSKLRRVFLSSSRIQNPAGMQCDTRVGCGARCSRRQARTTVRAYIVASNMTLAVSSMCT
jgi:hypothetical protein